jgi:hypothetical protein
MYNKHLFNRHNHGNLAGYACKINSQVIVVPN